MLRTQICSDQICVCLWAHIASCCRPNVRKYAEPAKPWCVYIIKLFYKHHHYMLRARCSPLPPSEVCCASKASSQNADAIIITIANIQPATSSTSSAAAAAFRQQQQTEYNIRTVCCRHRPKQEVYTCTARGGSIESNRSRSVGAIIKWVLPHSDRLRYAMRAAHARMQRMRIACR